MLVNAAVTQLAEAVATTPDRTLLFLLPTEQEVISQLELREVYSECRVHKIVTNDGCEAGFVSRGGAGTD